MVTVHASPDCGNAPRKEILRDVMVAMAEANGAVVAAWLREDSEWIIVGGQTLVGADAIVEWITHLTPATGLTFESVITHGREAGVSATLQYEDGSVAAVSHVWVFAGAAKTAKIASVKSYVIPLGRDT